MRSAQQLLTTPPSQTLSVADLLRLGSGETQVMEKLPVVSFEAQGVLEELLANLGRNEAIAPIDPPDTFRGQLRPYQARGLAWLAFLDRWGLGACLADDMGLGKTIQTIAFLLHLQHQQSLLHQATDDQSSQSSQSSQSPQSPQSKQSSRSKKSSPSHQPSLLLCPTSVLGNWEREVQKFAPTLRVGLHYGDKRSKGKDFAAAAQELDLIITSYPLMVRDWKTLHTVSWQVLILDEAQNIKNPDTKQSKAVRELNSQFRIALTGTPVENRLGELWSILDFLNPGYLGSRQFFQRRFALPIEKFGDRASLQVLRSLVQPLILRRLKTDRTIIQDLPEKQEMTVFCGLVPEQAALYQKLVDESLAEIDQLAGTKRNALVLTLLMRLKQVCNHPAQYLKTISHQSNQGELWQNFAQRSGKLKRLEEMLEELITEGDRFSKREATPTLIFTQFAELGTLLQGYLAHRFQQEVFFFHGGTKKNDRELMVDRFQNDPNAPKVMILSLKAGGTGLNLTRANHVFHFDRWWNPAVENQATDRAFRIGQTRNVQVHKFVCTGTLEEKINNLINSKKQLAEQTVDVGESWLTELDTDQLRNLLVLDRAAIIDLE
ncbi:MAG: DEAD/DEAH box helicase [Coleofasciculaceae cyanobacterium SM2_1_6]|nr:DEAD/DEAH box helicase [Coleofasciculaceae cyanobacterium SM2_1_6]